MAQMTITEALARLKTITKQIEAQFAFVISGTNLARPVQMVDPHAKDGGSESLVAAKLQSIRDLEEQRLRIRTKINDANAANSITIGGVTRSIEAWLIWRRDILGPQRLRLKTMSNVVQQMRAHVTTANRQQEDQRRKVAPTAPAAEALDIVVNYSETALQRDIEQVEEIAGTLDGALSLRNATITVATD